MNTDIDGIRKQFLFCPGPVNVADNVKAAAVKNEIGHREKEFSILLTSLNKNVLKVFRVKKPHLYHSIFITGSGTAANEAVLSSVVPQSKHILIVSNGEFGERLSDISKLHNKNTHHLKFKWGQYLDLFKIEQYLRYHTIDFIAMVHHETSTGMLNPVDEVGKLAKKYKVKLLLDTVSSAGADLIDLEKWNVAFCTSSAAKAISSLPGVSFVIGKHSEFKKLKNLSPKTMYLNLYKFYIYSVKYQQTPNTPAVQLFYALNQAFLNIIAEGIDEKRMRVQEITRYLRNGMNKLGLAFLIDERHMSSILTTVMLPRHVNISSFRKKLLQKDIVIYNGKGPFLNKVFQVGNIGDLGKKSATFFLNELKEVLKSFTPKTRKQRASQLPRLSSSFSIPIPKIPYYGRVLSTKQ